MKKYKTVYVLFLILILGSCKTMKTDISAKHKPLPEKYGTAQGDTTTVARIDWKEFFADDYLIQLIDTALANNLDLQMALQRIEAARSGLRFANGELFPKIEGSFTAATTKYAKYTEGFAGNSTTEFEGRTIPNPVQDYFAGLTATWEIDIWGKLRNSRKAALSRYLASIEGKNFVVSNLVADIAASYYDLLALDNELDIVRQTLRKQQEAFEVVELQKEVGKANELAVQQFLAQLLNTRAHEKETLQQIVETENKINFLMGRFPQPIPREKRSLFKELPRQIASGVPAQLLAYRPDIREAELELRASKFDVKTAKAAFFPSLAIEATGGYQAFDSKFLFRSPTSIGYSAIGGLVAPLINRKALKAEFHNAKAQQLTAMYQYQKTVLNGYMEVANGLSNLRNLQETKEIKEQQNQVLENAIEASAEFYRMAKADYLEVLMAQQNSLQAQLELIALNKRQQLATVSIYKALGGGWQ
ncbi:efflux transporter outer membrane subunit [Pseudozobellia thermophila]|uniref:Efflux transporter, outer membrane factor (OMF) lipoprotein, NodT family n=1 Tax=Pseudozobellia thermophila TaxID=192903 RepID=A0A1M6FUI2_9FLAO|nr:efflux transporter outer membrane subunit [Pseudozobellia thermophila]SHJ01303.1 efflux transporter, outer membrane factor (OMF) lipoprotein, NodT family [Pseudozobellia thermophila]